MKEISGTFFECKIRLTRQTEGGDKTVTDAFAVRGISWTDAEATIMENVSPMSSSGLDIRDIRRAPYGSVYFSDSDTADKWYRCKLSFVIINENTEKEKRSQVVYLVQASSLEAARKSIDEIMKPTMSDYEIKEVKETAILDVFVKEQTDK